MRSYDLEIRPQAALSPLRQVEEEEKEAEAQGLALRQCDPTAQLAAQSGSKPDSDAQLAALRRSVTGRSSGAAGSLLYLQRTYGNRHTQRLIARAAQDNEATEVAPEVEEAIQAARGSGQALDGGVRAQMEPAIGADFNGVRVHTDSEADSLNRSLSARAFTNSQDIFFRQGEYNPGTSTGRELLAHELAHVVQQKGGQLQTKLTLGQPGDEYEQEADNVARAVLQQEQQAIQRPDEREPEPRQTQTHRHSLLQLEGETRSPRLRLPTLEVFSAQQGGAFAGRGRSLVGNELSDAASVFGSSVNLDAVRIVETPVVNAPTTLGNYIRVAPGYTMTPSTLIHELAHVWQFQTKGTAYISDSIWHQVAGAISTGSRGAAYAVTIVQGQSIHEYAAEQQAVIIENYYAVPALRNDPDYQRLISEVRRARPIAMSTILDEAAHGPGAETERLRSIMGREPEPFMGGGNIPQIRIEF